MARDTDGRWTDEEIEEGFARLYAPLGRDAHEVERNMSILASTEEQFRIYVDFCSTHDPEHVKRFAETMQRS